MDKFMLLLIPGLAVGCIYGLIALGYSLIYKASGLMTLMQGDILTLGAYLGLTFSGPLKLPFGVSLTLTIILAFLFGMLLEKTVIRTLVRKNVSVAYIVLATIALSYIIQNGTSLIWGTIPLHFPSMFGNITSVHVAGIGVQPESLVCVGVSIVCMILLHFFMTKTRIGTSMRAAAMDAKAAESCGINTSLSTGLAWGLSAGIAGMAGMLIGPLYSVYALMGATIGRKGFSGAVAGGFGNMYGAIAGGVALGLVENFTAGYISSDLKNLIAYLLLLVFLLVRPTGIFNERAIQDV